MPPLVRIPPVEVDDRFTEIVDVRSPAEFAEDHLPGAINFPVLDDAERVEVGTLYKQVNPFVARRVGAAMIARNIAGYLETVLAEKPPHYRPLVYCWRGGQRSASMGTILSEVGWPVAVLEGGYTHYRKFVRDGIGRLTADGMFDFCLIAGLTGSGKTRILEALGARGHQVLDLERLANHRGSLLGRSYPVPRQPSQKAFENALFQGLRDFDPARPVFLEAESNKVGDLHIPPGLWERMRACPSVEILVPREARARFLLQAYPHFQEDTEHLLKTLEPLRRHLGAERLEWWHELIRAGEWPRFVESALEHHYDLAYTRSRKRLFQPASRVVAMADVRPESVASAADELVAPYSSR